MVRPLFNVIMPGLFPGASFPPKPIETAPLLPMVPMNPLPPSVAPELTLTFAVFASEPLSKRVPLSIFVAPTNVLALESVSVPVPFLVKSLPALPFISPLITTA